jgi:hypothetical protein
MDTLTLKVVLNSEIVFQSDRRWLQPLFELEEFLKSHPLDISRADVHDKVIGKAAAMLITRIGAGSVQAFRTPTRRWWHASIVTPRNCCLRSTTWSAPMHC